MTKPAENTIEARALRFIERVENLKQEIASERGKFMQWCEERQQEIKEVYDEAKDADLPLKPLKQIVKYRELERKQEALAAEMKGEDGEYDYEMLVAALGQISDLPLGQAALDLNGGGGDDKDDPRPRFKKTEDQPPAKKTRKPRSPAAEHAQALAGKESPEERAALGEIEAAGSIGGAAASFSVQ